MRAVTFQDPYALAALTVKDVDNRKTGIPEKLLGKRIAIHAGAAFDKGDKWGLHGRLRAAGLDFDRCVLGAIIGTVKLLGWVRPDGTGASTPAHYPECLKALDSPWRAPGAKCLWTLRDPIILAEPIPCKGALGFWTVPPEIEVRINAALRAQEIG